VGSRCACTPFLDDNFSAIRGWRSTADIAINAYIQISLVSGGEWRPMISADNPIDIATIRGPQWHSLCVAGDLRARRKNRESHAQLRPQRRDLVSSLILGNLDVLGDTEPLASTFKGNYPGSIGWHTILDDGNDGLLSQS